MDERKGYKAIKIGQGVDAKTGLLSSPKENTGQMTFFDYDPFAEIEMEGETTPGAKPAPEPLPLKPAPCEAQSRSRSENESGNENESEGEKEIRRLFGEMKNLARYSTSWFYENSGFYEKYMQHEISRIFYKQAVLMKDFEDDYPYEVPFSSYYPFYQKLGYEQLRTYFTWRTKARMGVFAKTSLSYVFIYIYELINNIGTEDPKDALSKLMSLWSAYKAYDNTVEKYLIKWVKDFHVYYELPFSFKEFVVQNGLEEFYPLIAADDAKSELCFSRLCGISGYNIKKSVFYNEKTSGMISACFDFIILRLQTVFKNSGISLEGLLYRSAKSKTLWLPFQGALFYPAIKQRGREVVFSEKEIYICEQNLWLQSALVPSGSGRRLLSYILKQTESELRRLTGYKYRLSVNTGALGEELSGRLKGAGISLEKEIKSAASDFYRERNKTVVKVDLSLLQRIRNEALDTQEKLIVPEDETETKTAAVKETVTGTATATDAAMPRKTEAATETETAMKTETLTATATESEAKAETGTATGNVSSLLSVTLPVNNAPRQQAASAPLLPEGWQRFAALLSKTETEALALVLSGGKDIRQFAHEKGVMPEVLADGINEKAFDCIGDNILETDDSRIYDEYRENILRILERT